LLKYNKKAMALLAKNFSTFAKV